MSIKKGFTLIEMMVVIGIVLISIAIWIYVLRNTSGVNQTPTVDQEYYFAYSRLLARLKVDLRSATDWQKVDEETYSMRVLADPKDGFPVEKEIVYKLTGNGKIVERNDGKSSVMFDFSSFKGGNTFVFHLSP